MSGDGPKPRFDASDPRAYPGGTIGITAGYDARFTEFYQCVVQTLAIGTPPETQVHFSVGTDVVHNCNELGKAVQGEWLWMLGDDHTWDPDCLLRLLAHDVDVVVPLVCKKRHPFEPVVYEKEVDGDAKYRRLQLTGRRGLVEVDAAGTAGMLVRKYVFDALEEPYFFLPKDNMQILSEDVAFCKKVKEAGFQIWCDIDTPMGHISAGSISVVRDEESGVWCWRIAYGAGGFIQPMPEFMANPEGRQEIIVP